MAVVNVTQARNDLFNMMNEVDNGEKFIITSKSTTAILMNSDEYESLIETLYLLSDPSMGEDIRVARKTPVTEMEVWKCPNSKSD